MWVFRYLSNFVFNVEKFLVVILIPLMLIAMVFDIIFRYFLNSPLLWGQEVALYSFVWSSFIGASMSIKTKSAVSVTLFVDRVNERLRNIVIIIGLLFATAFSIYILYLSFNWITDPSILFQKTITTQMPMIYMYLCIPVSLLFMTIHFIDWLIEAFKLSKDKKVIT